jgi:ComF family protein
LQNIKPLVSTTLEITKKYQMRVFCVGAYQEPLKNFILAKGRSDNLACYYMAQLIYHHSLFKHLEVDYIIPIPLHWRRYAKRGYNQSAEIAKHLSKWSGVPIIHALKRHKATPFQSQFSKEGRFENVQDVFSLVLSDEQKTALKNKRLLLIDDVMTTGATLISAGKLLRTLHPAQMNASVLARTG